MTAAVVQEEAIVKAAFGAKNRARLIERYFARHPGGTAGNAWKHVYRLLLWTDQTTGLAHCYESDKCQPGKNWYGRSLAFHDWVSRALDVPPTELTDQVDWLFRHAAADLATEVLHKAQALAVAAERQLKPYAGRAMPRPGEDAELVSIIRDVLGNHLTGEISSEKWQELVQRIRQYLALENKRKNLVGEGFEDVIASVIQRATTTAALEVRVRHPLQDLPGFSRAKTGDKPNKVDVSVVRPSDGMRTLVTAKWSVRADREKQFAAEFSDYAAAESERRPFEYVFVTNEFDPARLMRACEAFFGSNFMFKHVVHISTDALRSTYGTAPREESMRKVLNYIETQRLLSFDRWLQLLTTK